MCTARGPDRALVGVGVGSRTIGVLDRAPKERMMTITTAAPAPAATPTAATEPTVPQQGAALLSQAAGYVGYRTIAIGIRAGLIAALAEAPDGLTPGELATATGIDPFYAAVWCRAAYGAGACDRTGSGLTDATLPARAARRDAAARHDLARVRRRGVRHARAARGVRPVRGDPRRRNPDVVGRHAAGVDHRRRGDRAALLHAAGARRPGAGARAGRPPRHRRSHPRHGLRRRRRAWSGSPSTTPSARSSARTAMRTRSTARPSAWSRRVSATGSTWS